MGAVVTAASGYDLGYVWKGQAGGQYTGERTSGGYYINAAQAGEAPGRWSGRALGAVGLAAGQRVDRGVYEQIYRQVNPATGAKMGRSAPGYAKYDDHLARLMAAEPHATEDRVQELMREAAQATRKSAAYTDVTVSYSKSISVLHASIRENGRQARLAGDERIAAYWDAREQEFQEVLQAANRAGMAHLEEWAATRTGYHGTRVDGKEPGRYEDAGLIISSWLQGTSRDGDPQDHVHNQIARMSLTLRDAKWRAVDTMSLRAQLPAVQGVVTAHAQAALAQRFGVRWVARPDGLGFEIAGVTQAQMDAYSTRSQIISAATPAAVESWTAKHGRAPNRSELKHIQQEVTMATRRGKEDTEIDWDKYAQKWDATLGGDLAQIAPTVSRMRGPDGGVASRTPEPRNPEPGAEARAMSIALARVQMKSASWTRADLMREISAVIPAAALSMTPADAVRYTKELTDRALASETETVVCLEAPEYPALPGYLRRERDGRSVYTRPGTARYATHVQLSKEEQLVRLAQMTGAPCLEREVSAQLAGAAPETLEEQLLARAQDSGAHLATGMRLDQAAAVHAALTDPRTVSVIVGPAGSGKTYVAGQAARMWREARRGDVVGLAPSQAATNVLIEQAHIDAWNTAQFLGHSKTGGRGALGAGRPLVRGGVGRRPVKGGHPPAGKQDLAAGTLIILDEGSMTSIDDMQDIVAYAKSHGCKVLLTGDHEQLAAVEAAGGMLLLAREQGHLQLAVPVRFKEEWERDASLRLRSGDTTALNDYLEHGRIHGGTRDEVLADARRSYVAQVLAGRNVLLMAADHATCQQVSRAIRDDLQHLGIVDHEVQAEAVAALRDGSHATAGDLLLIRQVNHDLGLANGDVVRVDEVTSRGVVVRVTDGRDPETGEMRVTGEPITYRDAARYAELAYCATGHSGQGRTVGIGIGVVTGAEDRHWLYVAASRGADENHLHVVGRPVKPAEPEPGTREAPELAEHERMRREREGLPAPERAELEGAGELEFVATLSDVLERGGDEMSALQEQRRNLANADHLARLHTIFQGETQAAVRGRFERLLRDNLPEQYREVQLSGATTWLWRSLRAAEAAGRDAEDVLRQAIGSRTMDGTRDVAALIHSRVEEITGQLIPLPAGPFASQVPDIADPEQAEYVAEVAQALDERVEREAEFAAAAPPVWALNALGEIPEDPLERLAWEKRAEPIVRYRGLFGYENPVEPIGPEPTADSPDKRAHWHAAFAALGPVEGLDLRGAPDGLLLARRASYEAETEWAPQFVGDELRQVRTAAQAAFENATRAEAEAQTARDRGDEEVAARHDTLAASARAMAGVYAGHETAFEDTMAARAEWERATERTRHQAVVADSELRRRDPERELPALKSAEPERAAEEQQAELHMPPDEERETPQWVADLAERNRAARDRLDEMRSMRIPGEDHEAEDDGMAWPDMVARERDAILQPPAPEIEPAQGVLDEVGREPEMT